VAQPQAVCRPGRNALLDVATCSRPSRSRDLPAWEDGAAGAQTPPPPP
jgi:hypothetical protein